MFQMFHLLHMHMPDNAPSTTGVRPSRRSTFGHGPDAMPNQRHASALLSSRVMAFQKTIDLEEQAPGRRGSQVEVVAFFSSITLF